jgi:shikimate dehydrogenase
LLIGAGGAARGVILPLLEELPAEVIIANRTLATAEELVVRFGQHASARSHISAAPFEAVGGMFDIVINATSASLSAELPPIPASVFSAQTFAYDMMYGAQPTVFMQFAASHGAAVRDGLGMLVEQAAEAFVVWRGVRPETAPVYQWLRSQL